MPISLITFLNNGSVKLEKPEMDKNLTDIETAVNAAHGETINISTDTTLSTHRVALVDATAGVVTATLPDVATNKDKEYVIKKIDSSGNAVTIATTGSDAIEGTTELTLTTQWEIKRVISDGISWYVV